jgi:hypothetical protein
MASWSTLTGECRLSDSLNLDASKARTATRTTVKADAITSVSVNAERKLRPVVTSPLFALYWGRKGELEHIDCGIRI